MSYTKLFAHFVWATKLREPTISYPFTVNGYRRSSPRNPFAKLMRRVSSEVRNEPLWQKRKNMDADLNTLVGREIAGFRLTDRVGEGGMAMVFRGENLLDPSIVRAIKVVFPHLSAQPEFVKRFSLEARVLDQLQHPNIVRFHGLRQAQVDGSVLLVMEMELLDGDSLSAAVSPNLPVAQVVDWVRQGSEGVAAAHALGVVHRDLKPDNLLLTRSGQVKVLDFGIARAMDDLQRKTQVTTAGIVPGTPGYMAPEVCNGALPTAAADVYALGLTLYELLLGRHPFVEPGQPPQSGLQMMFAHVQRQLPPLRSHRPDAPEALELILARATAKDLTQRFPDAKALAAALRMGRTAALFRASTPPVTRQTPPPPPPRPSQPPPTPQPTPTNFKLPALRSSVAPAVVARAPLSAPPAQRNSGPPPAATSFQLPVSPASGIAIAAPSATRSAPPVQLQVRPASEDLMAVEVEEHTQPNIVEAATKCCPFCGETVLAVAIKCKHCGSDIGAKIQSSTLDPAVTPQSTSFHRPILPASSSSAGAQISIPSSPTTQLPVRQHSNLTDGTREKRLIIVLIGLVAAYGTWNYYCYLMYGTSDRWSLISIGLGVVALAIGIGKKIVKPTT